jgi:tetratricopeptide (TPR) repeat protein
MSQELFDEADRLEEIGEDQRALDLWRRIAETSPTRNAFLRLARLAQALGLVDDAVDAFKHALEIDNRSAPALMSLGVIEINRGNYEAAESYLRTACDIKEDPAGFSLLGVALRNIGKTQEAEQAHRRAIGLDPKYEEAYYNLGVVLKYDRPAEAQALFRTALELDPVYACAHRELGFLLTNAGANQEAETHLRKSIELAPNDVWAHIYLGSHLWRFGQPDAAVAEFRIAEEIKPEWAVPLLSLGNLHELAFQDFDLAQSFFERALQLEPDDGVTLYSLGRLCKKRGQVDLARQYLDRALLQDPGDERIRALLSDLNTTIG